MVLFDQLNEQMSALIEVLNKIGNIQYTQSLVCLSGATIGEHTRHIIEIFQCVQNGYASGKVDYVNRFRNVALQRDKVFGIASLEDLLTRCNREDKPIIVQLQSDDKSEIQLVTSSYYREISYNIEHAIHHMAFIKVGFFELKIPIESSRFGIAYSTLMYNQKTKNNE